MRKLVRESIVSELPFAISTMSAGNTLIISLLFAKISPTAVAAGPFIAAMQNFCIGICRASLSSTSLLIGPDNAQGKQHDSDSDNPAGMDNPYYTSIGQTMRAAWVFATLLSIGAVVPLLISEQILKLVGVNHEIAEEAAKYLRFYTIGVWPLLQSYVDQQLFVGVKSPLVPIIRGPLYAGLTFLLCYFGLHGLFGEHYSTTKNSMEAIGLGAALAGWAIFACTKLIHSFKTNRKYTMYVAQFDYMKQKLKGSARLGFKLGFQVACEWINLVGTSIIIGQLNKETVRSTQPVIQLGVLTALFSLGFSAAIGAVLTNNLGQFTSAAGNQDELSRLNRLFVSRGWTGIMVGMVVPCAVAIVMAVYPDAFSKILLHHPLQEAELNKSNRILRISSLSIFMDALRIIGAGPLRSFKDINYTTAVSFIVMSVIGLPVQAITTFVGKADIEVFFWIRNVKIIIPALLVLYRWKTYTSTSVAQKQELAELHTQRGNQLSSIFSPLKQLTSGGSVGSGAEDDKPLLPTCEN